MGGGTGLSTLLKGLKRYSHVSANLPSPFPLLDITAVVTVTDDGGSSGRLRREFGILPPGDIRNCMVALAEDEALMTRLFQFRFASGHGLKGHSFGNLFLTVLSQITGDFLKAVKLSSEVLAIAGRIYPSTDTRVTLRATLADGSVREGESKISRSTSPIRRLELSPRHCRPLTEALEAIRNADLIMMGPGSLYTSVIPNLLVRGIAGEVARSPAVKAYLMNLMTQPGETTGMTASDHLRAIECHAGGKLIDIAVLNSAPVRAPARRRYARQQARPVENDDAAIRELGIQAVRLPLLGESEMVRHDPERVALVALQLAKKGRRRILKARRVALG